MDGVSRPTHSPALDIAGVALATSLLIHGLAVTDRRAFYFVAGCVVLVLALLGWAVLRDPQSDRRRWLAPRELVPAGRRYASQGRWRRLHVCAWIFFVLIATLRFVVLLGEREWGRPPPKCL